VTNTLNLAVLKGEPPFRVTRILKSTVNSTDWRAINAPTQIAPGTRDVSVGVLGSQLPTQNARLTISGTGINVATTSFHPLAFSGLNLLETTIQVEPNAAPGLRTFCVQLGTNLAYANGYLEIMAPVPDFNFDGLDDRFQRKWFPLFTDPEAGPIANPDADPMTNLQEYLAGTNPLDAQSVLRINRVSRSGTQITIHWSGQSGIKYQVLSNSQPSSSNAVSESPILNGAEAEMQWELGAGVSAVRYYWVTVLF